MADYVVGLRLDADGNAVVTQARKAERAVDKFGDEAERSGRRAQRASRKVDNFARQFTRLRTIVAGSAVVLAGALGGRKALQSFSRFEQGLIEVRKTADLTSREMEALGGRIREISERVPVATENLLKIASAAGQLGVKGVDNIAAFTETLGQMQLATDVVGDEGARSLARILTITGDSIGNIDRLGSAVTDLGNNFATTEQEIVRTSTFIAQSTTAFDLNARQVVGLSAALRALGQRAETSGSAIGAALNEINTAIANGGDRLDTLTSLLDTTQDELREAFGRDAPAVLARFSEALGSLPAAEQTRILSEFNLAGRETARVIQSMASNAELVSGALDRSADAWERNNALRREAARASESFSAQMQLTRNELDQTLSIVGRELAPAILDLSQEFRTFLENANDTGELKESIDGLADATRELGDAFKFIVNNADTLLTVAGAYAGFRFGGPVGAGVGAIGAQVYLNGPTTTDNLSGVNEQIRTVRQMLEGGPGEWLSDDLEQQLDRLLRKRDRLLAQNVSQDARIFDLLEGGDPFGVFSGGNGPGGPGGGGPGGDGDGDPGRNLEKLNAELDEFIAKNNDAFAAAQALDQGFNTLSDAIAGGADEDRIAQARQAVFELGKVQVDTAKKSADEITEVQSKAAEEMADIWREAREQVQNFAADQIFAGLEGELDSVEDIADAFVDIWKRAFAEVAAVELFGPGGAFELFGQGGVRGPLSTIFGGQRPANDNGKVAIDDTEGLGAAVSDLKSTIDKAGAELFGTDNVSGNVQGPLLPGQSRGATLTDLIGGGLRTLGTAGVGFGLGDAAADILGLGKTGSRVAGGAGAGLLALPGLLGVSGPLGAGLGALVGLGSSLVGKTARSQATLGTGDIFTRGGGERGTATSLQDAVLQALNQIARAGGGRVDAGEEFGTIGRRGDEFFFDPRTGRGLGPKDFGDPRRFRFGSAEGATMAALERAVTTGVIEGLSPTASRIVRNSDAGTPEALLQDVQFAETFDQLVKLGRETSDFVERIKDLNQRFAEAIERADELGLSEERLAEARERALGQMREDFERKTELAILDITNPIQAALERQRDEARQYLLDAAAVGADLDQARKKVRLERQALINELASGAERAVRQFRDDIDGLLREITMGERSRLAPQERLPRLLSRFEDLAARAPEDEDARGQVTDAARRVLDVAGETFASGGRFFEIQREVEATLRELRETGIDTPDVDKIAEEVGKIEMDPQFQSLMEEIGNEIAQSNQDMTGLLEEIRDRLPSNGNAPNLPSGDLPPNAGAYYYGRYRQMFPGAA